MADDSLWYDDIRTMVTVSRDVYPDNVDEASVSNYIGTESWVSGITVGRRQLNHPKDDLICCIMLRVRKVHDALISTIRSHYERRRSIFWNRTLIHLNFLECLNSYISIHYCRWLIMSKDANIWCKSNWCTNVIEAMLTMSKKTPFNIRKHSMMWCKIMQRAKK